MSDISDQSEGSERCTHIVEALEGPEKAALSGKFKTAATWYFQRTHDSIHPNKRRKVASPTCGTCSVTLPRPFVCLHCLYSGCWAKSHIRSHLKHTSHLFCADPKTGQIYCSQCDNFILNRTFEEIFSATLLKAEESETRFQVAKKTRESYTSWKLDENDTTVLKNAVQIPCEGRRGLLNLGQTCFLNVILQCFIHNPLLRNYFLSGKHNCATCKNTDCTCCELDNLFSEIYSGEPGPYGPVSFLATTWRASSELAGYAQQDAHEFFIAALNQIHATSRGSTNVSCNCIIHSTFLGQLQSEVKCEKCGNVTSTMDPILDISLEVEGDKDSEATLGSCLRKFTKPETLGSKEYSCSKCKQAPHQVTKQLSIRELPPVLSVQFKRFEHRTGDKAAAKKIDTRVRFPASINMAPYTTFAVSGSGKGPSKGKTKYPNSDPFPYPGPDAMYEYDLFAVICHEGQIDNGHYTNFARFQDEWYRFDDEKVTPATLTQCLKSSAYMCFYVKKHLDYKPYIIPTYVLIREGEIVKERQREREKELERMKEVENDLLSTI